MPLVMPPQTHAYMYYMFLCICVYSYCVKLMWDLKDYTHMLVNKTGIKKTYGISVATTSSEFCSTWINASVIAVVCEIIAI